MFIIFLKLLQEYIITKYIRNTLSSESDCFHYLLHNIMVLPGNVYVVVMPKDTSECSELHHLNEIFFIPKPPSNLMHRKTFNSLKITPPMFKSGLTPFHALG